MKMTIVIDDVKKLIEEGFWVEPNFLKWMEKHPDVTGTHQFSLVKRKQSFFFRHLRQVR